MEKLIAIDGNSLMHRAFYALPPMITREGIPTGTVFGFISMLFRLLDYEPTRLLVAFDTHEPTFRHKEYDGYKAGRRETPDDLRAQFPIVKKLLMDMGIRVIECPGFEADDILGTFSRIAAEKGIETILVTGDKDVLQLIGKNVKALLTKKGVTETQLFDVETLKNEYALTPDQMRDLKGLMGDNSDNLPGIKGVGEKTALKLLEKYKTLEGVLANASNEKGALRLKLEEPKNIETALLSYRLGTINTNAPVKETLDDCTFDKGSIKNAIPYMTELELKKLIERIPKTETKNISSEIIESVKTTWVSGKADILRIAEIIAKEKVAAIFFSDSITIAFKKNEQYAIKLSSTPLETDDGTPIFETIRALRPFFESEVKKVVFDAKSILHKLKEYDINISNIVFDTMIADYILNATQSVNSLSDLMKERNVIGNADASAILSIATAMREELKDKNLDILYDEIEHPLIFVLYSMEEQGFFMDRSVLDALSLTFADKKEQLAKKIYALAGEEFNILSTKQLGVILFEKLGLPHGRKTKTGYSTDADVLDSLSDKHEILPLITNYRFITKLKSTFVDGLLPLIGIDGKVHTTLNQTVTATGRISSTEPNLQNIPVRTELGHKIRRAFIASPGNFLIDADYSQIELRVLAHISGDVGMIKAFKDGADIHARTAAEVFDTDEVTKEQRTAAKAVNFGIVYGISDFGLAKNLGVSRARAGEYITRYLERFSGVRSYMKESVETAKRLGYAATLMGRQRALPEINSSNFHSRSFGERVAMNMPIQGTAADIIKLAMVKVNERLREGGFKAKLILQIHDELIIDTPSNEVDEVSQILKECMENVVKLSVPIIADVGIGTSWFDAK
ncbi:MAG: DNA polymerase I [Clostridia bacterium]